MSRRRAPATGLGRALRRPLLAALAGAALALPAVPALAENLAGALATAYKHSGLLEQNRATLRAADEDVAQAVSALRPVLNYTGNVTTSYNEITGTGTTASLGLTGELLIFDGGRSQLGIDAAKESVLIAREALIEAEQRVLLNAVNAYLAVRRALAFVDLRNNNVRLITRELRAARDRFEVGEVTRTDVAIAESRLAEARANLASAEGDLREAAALYRAAVGIAPDNLAPMPAPPRTADSQDAAEAVAQRTHPALKQAMRRVTLAEINVARAEAAVKPRVTANAGLSVNQDFAESASVGLQLSGPITSGGRITSLYRQAVAQRDAARGALHVVRHQVGQEVATAWAQLLVANASLQASQQQIRAATVAFRGVQEEATLGSRTTLDVLNAENELLDARALAIAADISRDQAVYALLSAMGLLTAEHLGLNVLRYDPAAYYNAVRDAPGVKVSPQGQKLDGLLKALGRQ